MSKYLIDANLPYNFSLWKGENFLHVHDIDDSMTDSAIWELSKKNDLCIVTKDCDFSNRILLSTPPPKVIHIKTGNLRIKELYSFLKRVWPEIEILIKNHKLVNVFANRIEAIE